MDWGYRGNSSETIAKKRGGVQVNGLKAQKLITGCRGVGGLQAKGLRAQKLITGWNRVEGGWGWKAGKRVKSSETHNRVEGEGVTVSYCGR